MFVTQLSSLLNAEATSYLSTDSAASPSAVSTFSTTSRIPSCLGSPLNGFLFFSFLAAS